MSTRCQIKVKGSKCIIYKHCDGYPESENGVLYFLKPFTKKFRKERGDDPEYFIAQYLRHLATQEIKEDWRHGKLDFFGYGVDTELHGDISYLYTVNLKTGKIIVKKM
jgi:hypothetical protein